MKPKTLIIIGVVLAVLAVGFWMWKSKNSSTGNAVAALGKKKDGTPYTDKDVLKTADDIQKTPGWLKDVQAKATAAKRTLDAQLRMEAIWMLENA